MTARSAATIASLVLLTTVGGCTNFFEVPIPGLFHDPSYVAGLLVAALIVYLLVKVPLDNAGRADEPAPPSAMM